MAISFPMQEAKVKGVEHLIEIENPNRLHSRQSVKISEVDVTASFTSTLSRRERLACLCAACCRFNNTSVVCLL